MFDNTPNSNANGAVAGVNTSTLNTGERKAFHYIENIYDPDKHPVEDLQKYVVPQENELVFDVEGGIIYRAAHVDWQATLKTTLVPWRIQNTDEGNTSEQDWIFGVRGGPMMGEALLSIDFSIRPNVAQVDSTIMRPGASYALLFKGNNLDPDSGTIISAQYDQSSNLLNNRVPVKLAEIIDRTNTNIMTTSSFSVTENAESLTDGTRCTLVFYDQGGNFIPPAQPVMVQQTAYMRNHQIGIKYLTGIELVAPWFTNSGDPERLLVPINVNLHTIEFRAFAHYSDGTKVQGAVNGVDFNLYGLNEYRPTYPGQTAEIVLVHPLNPDEQFYLAQPGAPDFERRTYTLEAANPQGAYSPKIYTFPVWDPAISGYALRHFLYDLDRKARIDVTDKVTFNDQSAIYNPKSYGVSQNLVFNLNLRDVSPTNESVIFVQHTTISLLRNLTTAGQRWQVQFSHDKPAYGAQYLYTANYGGNNNLVWFEPTFNTKDKLLDALYWPVDPSYDRWNEEKAPTPTKGELMLADGRRYPFTFGITTTRLAFPVNLQVGSTVFVNWLADGPSGTTLQVGMSAVTVVAGT